MRRFNLFMLIGVGLVMAVFLAACTGKTTNEAENDSQDNSGTSDEEEVMNLSVSSSLQTMDTSLAADALSFQWLNVTKEGLYRYGLKGEHIPGVAKNHEVSEDGLTWVFHLRENAKWLNGDTVTAEDFVYSWRRALDPSTGSEYGPYVMGGIIKNSQAVIDGEMKPEELGVKAVDDFTLEVQLEKPIPYFKSMTSFGTFFPINKDKAEKYGEEYAMEAKSTDSNGPYTMKEWNHGEGWVVEKNPEYWDAENVDIEKITASVIKETSTAVNLYESGEVDHVELNSEFVSEYKTSEEYNTGLDPAVYFMKTNMEANKALANIKVRKALQMIVDRQSLVDVILNNGSIPATGFLPKGFAIHPETGQDLREMNGPLIETNKKKAKQLWNEAKDDLGIEKLELEYLSGDTEQSRNISAYIKAQLEELEGLNIKVVSVPGKIRTERMNNMNYELAMSAWGPDYRDPNTFMDLFVTDGPHNKTGFSNKEYDQLLKDAATTYVHDPEKRYDLFLKAERILVQEDAVIMPIYQRGKSYLVKSHIKGFRTNVMGPHYTYQDATIKE
ncbi:peptide ABC transporter substrate-binding protein [Halobacillus shinanisalinarum]|uniref:Peptide ABC transporter substrate-binding protein n=1 Tax=Halobacillus shinanisalinarum TaxID=2932258 RepID=A0ABY4GV93_9BACI|nr:peptide ABC transporter substrate-binding protein [Halobacillus shinanisalinarum]UOQ91944.1 peptide ABC transporter substrate-binding protein [Halobacillus shinanisalinarum]